MARLSAKIHIDAAPQEVWEFATDLERMDRWVSIHGGFPEDPPGELKPGSRFKQTLKVAGVTFHVEWTATEIDAPEQLAWEGVGPAGTKARTRYALAPEGGGTRFTFENEFTLPAGRIGKAAARIVTGRAQKEADQSLETLKALLES